MTFTAKLSDYLRQMAHAAHRERDTIERLKREGYVYEPDSDTWVKKVEDES
jgi:hypothetical protein